MMAARKTLSLKKQSTRDILIKLDNFDWNEFEDAPDRNKGRRGQAIERALGLSNSSSLLDLSDGELKTFTEGQTISITNLKHCLKGIVENIPFNQSKVGQKINNTIYIAFSKEGNYITHKNCFSCLQIEEDYNYISNMIRFAIETKREISKINTPNGGTITGPNGLLQVRTKGNPKKNGAYTPLIYNGNQIHNKHMAFYLRGVYGRKICNSVLL
jgi:hypothetical protein